MNNAITKDLDNQTHPNTPQQQKHPNNQKHPKNQTDTNNQMFVV